MSSRRNSLALVLFAGGMFSFSPLTTDMLAPALPTLATGFGAPVAVVQLTLSVYLVGFAASQLFYGPLADQFGRRPAILIGIAIYIAATFACMFSTSIEMLIVARFFQALGAAFGQVLGRAVIRDLSTPLESARVLAYTTAIMGTVSIVSPTVGGFVTEAFGWQAVFVLLSVYSGLYLVLVLALYRESVPQKLSNAMQPMQTVRNFARLLGSRTFARHTASIAFMYGALFSFISGAPFVFIFVFGVPTTQFGLMFAPLAGSFVLASLLLARVGGRFPAERLYGTAASVAATGGLLTLASAATGIGGIFGLIAGMVLVSSAMGVMTPLAFAGALEPHPEMAGTASTLVGFLQGVFAAAVGTVVGLLYDGTPVPMFAVIALLTTGALVSFVALRPRPVLA